MTKKYDLKEFVEETIKEKLEDDAYEIIVNALPYDDKRWWADNICPPIKDALIKELDKRDDLLKECLGNVFNDWFADRIEDVFEDCVREYIMSKMPEFEIKIKSK